MRGVLRRLRGAVGNALAWAGSWVAGGTAALGLLQRTSRSSIGVERFSIFARVDSPSAEDGGPGHWSEDVILRRFACPKRKRNPI
jgi:hypothetical protein